MKQFLNFDKMITPTIIKILFWVGVGLSALASLSIIISGLTSMFSYYGSAFMGFLMLIFGVISFGIGVLFSRVYCELLIVLFKIQGSLVSIENKFDEKTTAE